MLTNEMQMTVSNDLLIQQSPNLMYIKHTVLYIKHVYKTVCYIYSTQHFVYKRVVVVCVCVAALLIVPKDCSITSLYIQ